MAGSSARSLSQVSAPPRRSAGSLASFRCLGPARRAASYRRWNSSRRDRCCAPVRAGTACARSAAARGLPRRGAGRSPRAWARDRPKWRADVSAWPRAHPGTLRCAWSHAGTRGCRLPRRLPTARRHRGANWPSAAARCAAVAWVSGPGVVGCPAAAARRAPPAWHCGRRIAPPRAWLPAACDHACDWRAKRAHLPCRAPVRAAGCEA
mmetsp:Transcript_93278/g.246280  ORF Transcript_93278/g.246280 Transcript_93278/m.246280 type:complete len:208 (+) Transcript_93278:923-1546(+)